MYVMAATVLTAGSSGCFILWMIRESAWSHQAAPNKAPDIPDAYLWEISATASQSTTPSQSKDIADIAPGRCQKVPWCPSVSKVFPLLMLPTSLQLASVSNRQKRLLQQKVVKLCTQGMTLSHVSADGLGDEGQHLSSGRVRSVSDDDRVPTLKVREAGIWQQEQVRVAEFVESLEAHENKGGCSTSARLSP